MIENLPVVPKATRLGPCVAATGKFICIGLNYSDHAAETGATVPPGVGLGQKAPHYLKPGDVVEAGVQSLGRQRQDVITDWA